jgi:hypothetical protein
LPIGVGTPRRLTIAGISHLVDHATSDIFEVVLKKLKVDGNDAIAIGGSP